MNENSEPLPSMPDRIDAHLGGVFDANGDEVFAKSLSQRHGIRQAREDEWEEFCQQNQGDGLRCPPECSCNNVE